MTHDELVRFAAERVGGKVEDGDVMVRSIVEIGDGHVCPVNNFYQLTSPELFLKGLGVYTKDGAPFQFSWWGVKLGVQNMTFEKIEDIPLKFWECWFEAELEGGQQP